MDPATRPGALRLARPARRRALAATLAAAIVASTPLAVQALGTKPPPRMQGHLPTRLADVVGRDLQTFGLGFLGHLAIWTGDTVIEVLDEQPVVQENSFESFRGKTSFWGTVYYPGIDSMVNGWSSCKSVSDCGPRVPEPRAAFAVVHRAQHAKIIGASYTLSTSYRPFAYGRCDPGGCIAPQPGVYRSDAFVRDMFVSTADAWVAANPGNPAPIVLPGVSLPRNLYLYLTER